MEKEKRKSIFEVMSAVDITPYVFEKKVETKKGTMIVQKYLPWSRAIEQLKLKYPDAKITECTFPSQKFITAVIRESKESKEYIQHLCLTELPYFSDGSTCYVKTRIEIPSENVDEFCTLPVLDYKNLPVRVENVTMDMVNKALRRCATKNIAMATGLGLGLWHKEELSEAAETQKILDKLDRHEAISKFQSLIKKGFDRDKLIKWSKENFGTTNPNAIKSDEVLERLSQALDKLNIEDFKKGE